ncbi:thiol reductant ABC exporter subunit CydC [Formicincola oecophyllae]|uniref:Thiol reductant ABC exporter subunit CydC n=1 Tax=Formicincola oecophyllae TaxID=2558361 RepID=A0A4Y6UA60_9PROT|nr:thiol reductant ABC exporter subunit CydC [Formicincola oecophyllae]QDH13346.1 thiol reductant ABC exporter subunit CydC [Formicincola oecophyllae]
MNAPTAKASFSSKPFLYRIRWILVGGLVLASVSSLFTFGLLFLSGWFLAAAAVAGWGGAAAHAAFNIFPPACGVRFFALGRIVTRYLERLVTHDAALRNTGDLRTWSFARLVPRSVPLMLRARSGDVLSRFVKDTETIGQYPLDVLLPCSTAVLCSLVMVGVAALFCGHAAGWMAVGLTLGGLMLPVAAGRACSRLIAEEVRHTEKLRADLLEDLQGMADIIFCGAAERKLAEAAQTQRSLNKVSAQQGKRALMLRHLLTPIVMGTVLLVLAAASKAHLAGLLSGPEIPMLGLGALTGFEVVQPLVDARVAQARYNQAAQRAAALYNLPVPVDEVAKAPLPKRYDLAMADVTMRFNGHDVLQGATLHLAEGERMAITGPSGAGKTTLIRLAVRFLDPDSGSISFGGTPLSDLTTEELSGSVGVMLQHPHLFQGTLRRNLHLAAPGATEEAMWGALETVGLAAEVRAMAEGLDTPCGDHGQSLSGGQIRRFAAAQVLLRKPKVMILDEPTESLPPQAGEELIGAMLSALPEASVLCITHRAEPLRFMNRVLRLKNGALVPQKT